MLRALGPLALFAAMTASCLITSTPNFSPPEQTPPFLIGSGANHPLGALYIYDTSSYRPTDPRTWLAFSAPIRSEDAGEEPQVELVVDNDFQGANRGDRVNASNFGDTTRTATAKWPSAFDVGSCHRFTLVASHKFADSRASNPGCPADASDASALSWLAVFCNGPCPTTFDPEVCNSMISGSASTGTSGGASPCP